LPGLSLIRFPATIRPQSQREIVGFLEGTEKRKMRLTFALKTAIAAGFIAASIAGTTRANAQKINGAGASFPNPIYQKWIFEHKKINPGVEINYASVGSGAGIAQYKAGTVDFGATDAPLSDAEQSSMPQPTLHIPTVAGAVVMAYNVPGIGNGMRLSAESISGIYLGHITTWNHPAIAKDNPGATLPATPITVVHRSDSSGTTYIFTSYLGAVNGEWNSKVAIGKSVNWPVGIGGKGNDGVAGLIKNSAGSIGYVELAYAVQNKLNHGPVKNKAGKYVDASIASTTEAANAGVARMKKDIRVSIVDGPGANTYPIAGFTYLLVSKTPRDAAKGKALVDFLKWALGPGQTMAEALLYAPLPKTVVALNEHSLSQIRVAGK
jgi:phosphate transport system substrate-binding protein